MKKSLMIQAAIVLGLSAGIAAFAEAAPNQVICVVMAEEAPTHYTKTLAFKTVDLTPKTPVELYKDEHGSYLLTPSEGGSHSIVIGQPNSWNFASGNLDQQLTLGVSSMKRLVVCAKSPVERK